MLTQLFDGHTLLTYVATATLLVVAPGPGQALVVARTLQGGARAGVLTSVGLEIGTLVHTIAAALGLSAILVTSATAFAVVKYVGAAYLLVLGVLTLWRSRGRRTDAAIVAPRTDGVSGGRLVAHAAAAGILNPKVALFFLALLPQFVRPDRGAVLVQFLVLGLVLSSLGLAWDATISVVAGRTRGRLLNNPRFLAWRERATGAMLVALGLRLAIVDRR